MQVVHKNDWFHFISGLLMMVGVSLLLKGVGFAFMDYEGFDLEIFLYIISAIAFLSSVFFRPRIDLTNEAIHVNGFRKIVVPYGDVLGISSYKSTLRIEMKNGEYYGISSQQVKNFEEVKTFLLKTKGISEVPFRFFRRPRGFSLILLLIFIGMISLPILERINPQIRNYLPLMSIKVERIKGKLIEDAKVFLEKNKENEIRYVQAFLELEEYPGILFEYQRRPESLSDKRKMLDNTIVLYEEENNVIPKGTEVELKIRTSDMEQLKKKPTSMMESEKGVNSIIFYSLAIDEKVMLEKRHLREVE